MLVFKLFINMKLCDFVAYYVTYFVTLLTILSRIINRMAYHFYISIVNVYYDIYL